MLGYPKLRRANIPVDERDIFERTGEAGIQLLLIRGLPAYSVELSTIYSNKESVRHAQDWLTERADIHARHEWRMERVEWAILIFLVIGVFADLSLAFHWFGSCF